MGSCGHGLLITAVACVSFAAFIGRYRALFRTSDRHGAACDVFQSAGTVSIVVGACMSVVAMPCSLLTQRGLQGSSQVAQGPARACLACWWHGLVLA